MDMLLSKTPPTDVKNDVLPMIYRRVGQLFLVLLIFNSSTDFSCRALESDASQIQELCLSILPGFAGKYDLVILIPLLRLLTNLN